MNRKIKLLIAAMLISSTTISAQVSPYESKIDEIISQMTLQQKVGQMAQLCSDVLGKMDSNGDTLIIDEQKIDEIFGTYMVGSILNAPYTTPLSPENWERLIEVIQEKSMKYIGIPAIYGVDAIHGTTYTRGATFIPQQIGLAATFNTELVEQGAAMSAYETRASNIPWNFAPVLDMGRDARWARIWETFGEDTYLTTQMGVAVINGFQGGDRQNIGESHVAACLKHFIGYGITTTGKDREPGFISTMELEERYLPPFKAAIDAGALSVMVNSGVLNGISVHASKELLTDLLKNRCNFDGVIVTDWGDITNLHRRDKIANNEKESIKIAINAGVDMSMIAYDPKFCNYLVELVNEGDVSMERIDDAVRRILRMKFRLGLFDTNSYKSQDYDDFGSDKHQSIALAAAEESITLLKNEKSILPLSKDVKVLVTGPNANSMRTLNGGWTLSWQGQNGDKYEIRHNHILNAITEKVGEKNVIFSPGVLYDMDGKYDQELEPDIEAALLAAKDVDVIVACVGENSYCEKPGDLNDLYLSDNQQNLISALATTGKPIVLLLNQGRPRVISKIEPMVDAIINAYLPGSFGGEAIANILFGDTNPSGRLPYTYPKYPNSLLNYDFKMCQSQEKMAGAYDYQATQSLQYPFGYGLSYTTFEYSNLTVDRAQFGLDDKITLSIDVTNVGERAGKESVLLFSRDMVASVTPDNRRLRRFSKVELLPNQTKKVSFTLQADDLFFVGADNQWQIEPGTFEIYIGTETTSVEYVE